MLRTLALLLATSALATSQATSVIPAADRKAYLAAHNTLRAKHNATALVWNQTLANAAASWASKCDFDPSGYVRYGENLAAGINETAAQAVASWASDESACSFRLFSYVTLTDVETGFYDPTNPEPSYYTQAVWKASRQLGCAYYTCSASAIYSSPIPGTAVFHVCEYYPAGNIPGSFPYVFA
jgi:pathogenesis-related protein 1